MLCQLRRKGKFAVVSVEIVLENSGFAFNFIGVLLKYVVVITSMVIPSAIAFRWMALDPTDDMSTLVQAIVGLMLENWVSYNTILRTEMALQRKNMDQTVQPQKTPHSLPSSILE